MQLGKIKEVPLREIWKHEQYDFSDWLSKEENISELSEVLGLSLVDIEKEKPVGSYSCDICCRDELTDKVVIIENQLEPTNHDHLGKIITYASGLNASVIVWIVESAREEHASAIEWLNKHIDANIDFFLIEIHAVKIGDSLPAPMFKIIEQPNDFNQQIKEISKRDSMTESMTRRIEFWTMLNDVIAERGKPINPRKPSTNAWYGVSIGSSDCHMNIVLVNMEGHIRIELLIPDNKELFEKLYQNKNDIESKMECSLIWQKLEDKQASRVSLRIEGLDYNNQSNYKELMNKAIDAVLKFKSTIKKYL